MEYFAAIAFFLALSAPTNADGSLGGLVYAPGHASVDYYAYPRYAFEYSVRDPHTGDNKAQWEKRDGDVVIGAYSLVEPDGSLRVVEYRADDKTGFNAVVKRIGPNIHPIATPIYKASIPSLGYKSYLPHPIGPVGGLEKLAGAPLYNGPYTGKADSSGLLYKSIAPAIIKEVAPISPLGKIIEAPINVHDSVYKTEIIHEPNYKGPIIPIYKVPNPQVPIYKAPILQESYGPAKLPLPILEQAPLTREPLYSPYLGKSSLGIPALKNFEPMAYRGIDYNDLLGKGLFDYRGLIDNKAQLGYRGILDYNAPLGSRGYSGPGLGYGH